MTKSQFKLTAFWRRNDSHQDQNPDGNLKNVKILTAPFLIWRKILTFLIFDTYKS